MVLSTLKEWEMCAWILGIVRKGYSLRKWHLRGKSEGGDKSLFDLREAVKSNPARGESEVEGRSMASARNRAIVTAECWVPVEGEVWGEASCVSKGHMRQRFVGHSKDLVLLWGLWFKTNPQCYMKICQRVEPVGSIGIEGTGCHEFTGFNYKKRSLHFPLVDQDVLNWVSESIFSWQLRKILMLYMKLFSSPIEDFEFNFGFKVFPIVERYW